MPLVTPLVLIIDADPSARAEVEDLALQAGFRVQGFENPQVFLASARPPGPCCLVLDTALADGGALELQERLATQRSQIPVIFLSSRPDIRLAVRAMKAGAVEFLSKPYNAVELTEALWTAIHQWGAAQADNVSLRGMQTRYALLTERQKEVMALVIAGYMNKQIGAQLGISLVTVKVHRGRVMQTMQATSLAHLVDMARGLGITPVARGGRARARDPATFTPIAWAQ